MLKKKAIMQLRNGTAKAHRLIGVMAFIASICPKCHRESKRENDINKQEKWESPRRLYE